MKKVLREIGMIGRCCATISDIEFKEIGLAKGQYMYLVRIYENPGIIQDRVADMLKVDRSTAAKAVKKLLGDGLIERVRKEGNKKEYKLYCAEKGRELYPFLEREEGHSLKVAVEGIPVEEVEMAYSVLKRMRINIEKDWQTVKKGDRRKY